MEIVKIGVNNNGCQFTGQNAYTLTFYHFQYVGNNWRNEFEGLPVLRIDYIKDFSYIRNHYTQKLTKTQLSNLIAAIFIVYNIILSFMGFYEFYISGMVYFIILNLLALVFYNLYSLVYTFLIGFCVGFMEHTYGYGTMDFFWNNYSFVCVHNSYKLIIIQYGSKKLYLLRERLNM